MLLGLASLAAAACRTAPVTLRAGLLLDGRGGRLRDAVITVVQGRITAVAPWRGDSVTWDLSRYTVLPGLIDAHVHITGYVNRLGKANTTGDGETPEQKSRGHAANALATLLAGFTTVQSLGSFADRDLRDRIDDGKIPGPRVLTSITQLRGAGLPPDSLRRLVRRVNGRGGDVVKIFASTALLEGGTPTLTDQQLAVLCGEATRLRLRSVVHAQDDAGLRQAAAAGCTQVEHGFLATAEGLGVLAERGVYFDPQCGLVFHNYVDNRARFEGIAGFGPAEFAMMERKLPTMPALIRTALATPGLKILYGTDAIAGAHGKNAEDLVCRVREAGEPPMGALVSATSRNAQALGLGEEIGSIAAGYRADIIALEGDPLQEIEAVRRVVFVMREGKVYKSSPSSPTSASSLSPPSSPAKYRVVGMGPLLESVP